MQIMIGNYIKIYDNIQISRCGEEDWYTSKIQDLDQRYLFVDTPYLQNIPLILQSGEQVNGRAFLDSGKFEFQTRYLEKRYDNIPLLTLSMPQEYKHYQMRKFARLPIMIDVYFAEQQHVSKGKPLFMKATSLDLSGNGMRIATKKSYDCGALLLIKFDLSTRNLNFKVSVTGRVVRVASPDQNQTFHVAVQFNDITRHQEDLIMRFIFHKTTERKRLA